MDEINWFSMALATSTPMAVGFVYYHKTVFGTIWMDTVGMTDKKAKKVNKIGAVIALLLCSFLLSFFLLNFNNSGINQEGDFDTFNHGVWHGVFVAITVVAPVIVIQGFFGQKHWKHVLINIGYWIITLALMGGILDVMNHWENVVIA